MSRQPAAAILVSALAACSGSESQKTLPKSESPKLAVNGGFESGTLDGWTVDSFTNPGITFPPATEADLRLAAGGTKTSSAVTSPPGASLGTLDELGPSGGLHFPIFGSWSALVNGQSSNAFGHAGNVNKLSQSYTLTAADIDPSDGRIHVRLVVAPILEDGGHPASQQPYVFIQAVNTSKGMVIGTDFTSANQPGIAWQRMTSPLTGLPVVYTDWRLVDFAPGNAALQVGDTVFVEIVAAGCATGSHAGEVLVGSVGAAVPGLSVSSTAALQVNANADIVYNHAVHNGGVLASTNVIVTQPIIPGTSYVSVTAPVTASCTTPLLGAISGDVVCNLGTVNAAATVNLKVTLKAPSGTGQLLNANAKVTADGGASLDANQVVSDVVSEVRFADVQLSIDDGLAALNWDSMTTYSVGVTNAGPSAAHAVTLTIPQPQGAVNTAWTCTPTAGGPLIATLPPPGTGTLVSVFDMPANSTMSCSYTAQVAAGSGPGTLSLSGTALDSNTVNPIPADGTAADLDQLSDSLVDIAVVKDEAGIGQGVVVSGPAQINCGATCTRQFAPGVPIALTATGNPGSQFTSWNGTSCNGSTLPVCVFTPGANTTITARFDKLTFPIAANVTGSGTVVCPAVAAQGATVACTVTPAAGFQLWSLADEGTDVTGQVAAGRYTETNVQTAHRLTAVFVKVNGVLCGSSDDCGSGVCADGVCCATACNGQCQACDVPGHAGTCTTLAAGDAPHGNRAACASDGSLCGGACDGTHTASCTFPGSGTACREGSCAAGTATLAAACDGAGSCPAVQTQSCAPFICGATACRGNCSADSDCTSGDFCSAGICAPKRAPGATCAATDQCGSGFCVDGLCCDTACDGQCEACNVPGSAGACSPVTFAPRGSRTACATDGSSCGGSCDGQNRDACAFAGTDAICRGPSCTGGVATAAASCNAAGACGAKTQTSCGTFGCSGNACISSTETLTALAGTGCSSGGGSIAPILGLVMVAMFRKRKLVAQSGTRARSVRRPAAARAHACSRAGRDGARRQGRAACVRTETAKAVLLGSSLPILDQVATFGVACRGGPGSSDCQRHLGGTPAEPPRRVRHQRIERQERRSKSELPV